MRLLTLPFIGMLALLGVGFDGGIATAQSGNPQSVVPLTIPSTSSAPTALESATYGGANSPPPRGWLQQPTSSPASFEPFTPFMLGDFIGPRFNMFSDVKIGEGESPRPMSRVYYNFNYYQNLEATRVHDPIEQQREVDLYRNVFGIEQALFDNSFSIGLRVPFNTLDVGPRFLGAAPGSEPYTTTQFGNVSAVLKALMWEDRASGSLLSGGVTISVPTASSKSINPGMSTAAFVQPFVGYIFQRGDYFVQGFSSVTVPLLSSQSICLFNDIGIGYYAYRNSCSNSGLTAIVPTLEVHVFTPLKEADPTANIGGTVDDLRLNDIVNITLGTTFVFSNRASLGVAVVSPVSTSRSFDVEGLIQLNYRY